MASICLYDIDLLHGSTFVPNLELMKIFAYYYNRGDLIVLGKKKEEFERFNHIIYFKQNPNLKIPKTVSLSGEKKQIYGYGFFRTFNELKDKYKECAPMFLPYDVIYEDLKNKVNYKKIRNNSIVRVENHDLTGFYPDKTTIFIADEDIFRAKDIKDFCLEYHKKYNLQFLHSIVARNQEDFLSVFPFTVKSSRQMIVDFDYSKDFFEKYYYENIQFKIDIDFNCYEKTLEHIINMIFYAKQHNNSITIISSNFAAHDKKKYPLLNLLSDILLWGKTLTTKSFYEYCIEKGKVKMFDQYLNNNSDFRLLLKTNPLSTVVNLTF